MSSTITSAGTLTSAALTTTFSPAPSCTNDFYTAGIYYSIGGPLASECFPSGWASTSQYFSPGICPTGYTQACSSLSTYGTEVETFATCCPSGYVCYTPTIFNFPGQACASIFTSEITTIVTDGSALTVELATLHPSTEAVNGYGVSIRYNDKDFSTSSSSTAATTTTSTSSPIATTSTSTASASGTDSQSPEKTSTVPSPNGMSTGAKAGIGIGIAAIAIFFLFGIVYVIMQRRRRKAVSDYSVRMVQQDGDGNGNGKNEYYMVPVVHPVEVDAAPPERLVEVEGSPGWR